MKFCEDYNKKKNKTPEQALGFFLDINLFLSQPFNLNEFRKQQQP